MLDKKDPYNKVIYFCRGKYLYFNKLKFIVEYLNVKIEHLDLNSIRETSQSVVAGIIG